MKKLSVALLVICWVLSGLVTAQQQKKSDSAD
jgi:hypothetical protein